MKKRALSKALPERTRLRRASDEVREGRMVFIITGCLSDKRDCAGVV